MKKFLSLTLSVLIAVSCLLLLPVPAAHAAVCTWTGTNSGNWNDSGNWSGCGGGVPIDGDDVYIIGGGLNLGTMNNDIGTLSLASLQISANGVNLSGSPLELIVLNLASNSNTIATNITMEGSGPSITNNGTSNTISNPIALNADSGTDFNITTDQDFSAPAFTGTANSFHKWGTATLVLDNGSTFTVAGGGVTIRAGTLDCSSNDCVGNSANTVAQFGTARLLLSGSATLPNPVTLNYGSGVTSEVGIELSGGVGVSLTGALGMFGPAKILLGNGSNFQTTGAVNMSSTLEIEGNTAATSQYLVSTSGLTSGGELSCTNVKCWLDTNSPTYDGVIRGKAGSIIQPSYDNSLGSTVGNTIIENGAMLRMIDGADKTIAENINVVGTGISGSGAIRNEDTAGDRDLSGTVTLAGNTTISHGTSAAADLAFLGAIDGSGDLSFVGTDGAQVGLGGSSSNTYTGTTTVSGVDLSVAKTSGVGIPGDINVTSTASISSTLSTSNAGGNQIADDSTITLTNNGLNVSRFDSVDDGEVVGTVVGNGHLEADGGGTGFTIGGGNLSGTFTGTIDNEDGTITKIGTGTWTLDGVTQPGFGNTFSFVVDGGKIVWNSTVSGAPMTVNTGGTLKGNGTVGTTTINTGGTINVGNSPGCMTVATLNLTSGSNFDEEIAGAAACTEYDRTIVTGAANLNNATLNVLPTYTPTPGTIFTIIQAGSVTGTFNGLADGATFTANGIQFRINYTGTQVNLTVLGGSLAPTGQGTGWIQIVASLLIVSSAAGLLIVWRRKQLFPKLK